MRPTMALRIGLLRSSALQNDGHDVPVILQCRTPQETNPTLPRWLNDSLINQLLTAGIDNLSASDAA